MARTNLLWNITMRRFSSELEVQISQSILDELGIVTGNAARTGSEDSGWMVGDPEVQMGTERSVPNGPTTSRM